MKRIRINTRRMAVFLLIAILAVTAAAAALYFYIGGRPTALRDPVTETGGDSRHNGFHSRRYAGTAGAGQEDPIRRHS